MRITKNFRDKIVKALPELSQELAAKIAATENCSTATVYLHWKKLKNLDGEISTIMVAIGEIAAERQRINTKQVNKIMQQLSAA